ncbi:hypothetical protein BGX30_005891, partial [Mortierella sp. GBA39]
MGVPDCSEAGCMIAEEYELVDVDGKQEMVKKQRCVRTIHAEQNLLLFTDRIDREGSSVYVTDEPCWTCANMLANSGVTEIVYHRPYPKDTEKVTEMMRQKGITFRRLPVYEPPRETVMTEAANVSKLPEALQAADAAQIDGASVRMTGMIASAVEVDGDRADFVMSVRQAVPIGGTAASGKPNSRDAGTNMGSERTVSEKVMVQVKLKSRQEQEAARQWQRGDRVRISGSLTQPQSARNFGGFDYRQYLVTQKIHWLFKAAGASNVQASAPSGFGMTLLLRWNDQARNGLSGMIDRIFQEPHAGYMKGLIIGLQDDLDPETYAQFSQLGLTHILAISALYGLLYFGKGWSLSRRQMAVVPDATVPLDVPPAARRPEAALPSRTKTRLAAGALGGLCILIVLLYAGYQPEHFRGAGAVQVLDVGQGDSILITTPQGKHLLVDGGGTVSFRKAEDGWKERKQPFEVGAK